MENVEVASTNAGTIYGLNLYLLTIANPVNMMYNSYTIATNSKLTYVQPGLNGWQRFWRSKWGTGVAIGLYIAGCLLSVICPAFAPMFLMAVTLTAVTLAIGGTIAGIRSKRQGKGFWSGFDNYINHNWAQSLSISIAITMITFGISQAIQAASAAGSKSELANVVKNPELMSGLSDQQILAIQNAAKDLPKGNYSVYLSKTDVYVGITGRSAPIRAAEHLAKSQRIIEPFISGLSKESARIVEQSVIEIV